MTRDEHIARHKKLHKALDELVADYISHTENSLMETTVMDLILWSADQTANPDIRGEDDTH